MSKILCSTGALLGGAKGRDYRQLKELSEQLTCDGLELMIYPMWYEEVKELVSFFKEMNFYIPVVHAEKTIGEKISEGGEEALQDALNRFEINCSIAKSIGAGQMVLHLWSGRASDQQFENNLQAYPKFLEVTEKYGIELLIENVVCNKENPMKHLRELAEQYPRIRFVFDTKMAAFHEELELLYEEQYDWLWKNGHIRHYHVNDYGGGYMDWTSLLGNVLPVGKGHIDFERFFAFMKKTGYDGTYTLEATAFNKDGVVDVKMLNEQFARVREYLEK